MTQSLYSLGNGLRVLLFHRFFFDGESQEFARDRLKRQCEFLSKTFEPLRLNEAQNHLDRDDLPKNALLVTIDDAKIEILDVLDIFRSFSIPIAIFACVGWCAQEEALGIDCEIALARLVADIQWYRGASRKLNVASLELRIGQSEEQTAWEIDRLLEFARSNPSAVNDLPTLRNSIPRVSCTFAELSAITSEQVAIGGHSASHINLANASPLRQDYEINSTKRILDKSIGRVSAFAYPYGMSNTHSVHTRCILKKAGFDFAFLTHSGIANSATDPLALPRISMPDRAMPDYEFRARCAGVGILYRKLRSTFLSHRV